MQESYFSLTEPILRSIWENIQTAVLKYVPDKVRKTKVQIFSQMDQGNWSLRDLLYNYNQRPKPSL